MTARDALIEYAATSRTVTADGLAPYLDALVAEVRAEAAADEALCVCGHPVTQHFEDVCLTKCGCNDALTIETAAEERARAEGAIHALRAAAEHARIGAAVGPIPLEVRPAVAAWLCRLADQRRDQAVAAAAALAERQPTKGARP